MRFILAATLMALPVTPALADRTVTFPNGGTAEWTRDCTRGDGQASCTASGLFTGPEGKTATKLRERTITPGSSVTEITVTGPKGETRTRTREVTWGN